MSSQVSAHTDDCQGGQNGVFVVVKMGKNNIIINIRPFPREGFLIYYIIIIILIIIIIMNNNIIIIMHYVVV